MLIVNPTFPSSMDACVHVTKHTNAHMITFSGSGTRFSINCNSNMRIKKKKKHLNNVRFGVYVLLFLHV